MRTGANNRGGQTAQPPRPTAHHYKVLKENKSDTIYELVTLFKEPTFLTYLVKLEQFQGFSNGKNFQLYFRIRNKSSWKASTTITGLFKTAIQGTYRGNIKTRNTRTLVIFKLHPNGEEMNVYTFPTGYYPSPFIIEAIAAHL
jgi:hypothetical protein